MDFGDFVMNFNAGTLQNVFWALETSYDEGPGPLKKNVYWEKWNFGF